MRIRIGTRGSDLALWQARHVAALLEAEPGVACELCVLATRGDVIDDVPLQTVEGKGFFTAEIERALIAREVDLAVHSHKDLATEGPPGLVIAAIPRRAAAGEWLLCSPEGHEPDAPFLPLRHGARVGTSAPRRQEQLRTLRPDLELLDLRGNVPTRVRKLREGHYDAVVLAQAGLERLQLDLSLLVVHALPLDLVVPAPAQGALAVQAREGERELLDLCRRKLHHEESARAVAAERRLLVEIGGGCNLPLGVHVGADGAVAFLGAGHPRPGQRARWARAAGTDPGAVIDALCAQLFSQAPTRIGPLRGMRVALTGSAEGPSELAERLVTLGAEVLPERAIAFEDLGTSQALQERLAALLPGAAVAVTSRRAAAALSGARLPGGVRLAAVGPATARVLSVAGLRVDVVGMGGGRELAAALEVDEGERVLFPCAEEARHELEEELARRGVSVERFPLYRTVPVRGLALDPDVDARVYLSPSAVHAALNWERTHPGGCCLRLALGPTTAAALRAAGLELVECIPGASPVEGLVRSLLQSVPGLVARRANPATRA